MARSPAPTWTDETNPVLRHRIIVWDATPDDQQGQAPAPDFPSSRGNRWLVETIDNWKRPGQGARTDLGGQADD